MLMATETEFRDFLAGRPSSYEWFTVTPPYKEVIAAAGKWTVVLEGTVDNHVALFDDAFPMTAGLQAVLNPHAAQSLTPGGAQPTVTSEHLMPALPGLTAGMPVAAPGGGGDATAQSTKDVAGRVIDTISDWGNAVERFGDRSAAWAGALGSELADQLDLPGWLRDFFGGLFGSLKGTIAGLGDTVSLLWDLLHTTQGWKDLGQWLQTVSPVDEAKAIGKDLVAWDDWANGKYAHAVGQIVGNLLALEGAAKVLAQLRMLRKGKRPHGSDDVDGDGAGSEDSKNKGEEDEDDGDSPSVEPVTGKLPKKGVPNSYGYDSNGDLLSYANDRPKPSKKQVLDVWNNSRSEQAAEIASGRLNLPAPGKDQLWVRVLDNVAGPDVHKVRLPDGTEGRYRLIEWRPGELRKGLWDLGHRGSAKYSELRENYLSHRISKDDFLHQFGLAENYRVEDPLRNQSHVDEHR